MTEGCNTDPATGAYTEKGFLEAVHPLIHLSQRNNYNVGLLIVGVDGFQSIREVHGNDRAGGVLKTVAGIIKSHIRASDIMGRNGKDSFIVYMPQVDEKVLPRLAETIRAYVEMDTMKDIPVTASIGAAQGCFGKNVAKDLERLIEKAGENFSRARASGKNMAVLSAL